MTEIYEIFSKVDLLYKKYNAPTATYFITVAVCIASVLYSHIKPTIIEENKDLSSDISISIWHEVKTHYQSNNFTYIKLTNSSSLPRVVDINLYSPDTGELLYVNKPTSNRIRHTEIMEPSYSIAAGLLLRPYETISVRYNFKLHEPSTGHGFRIAFFLDYFRQITLIYETCIDNNDCETIKIKSWLSPFGDSVKLALSLFLMSTIMLQVYFFYIKDENE